MIDCSYMRAMFPPRHSRIATYIFGTMSASAVRPPGEEYVNVYGVDLTARKEAEAAVRASEEGVRRKLKTVLSPEGDLGVLSLPNACGDGLLDGGRAA